MCLGTPQCSCESCRPVYTCARVNVTRHALASPGISLRWCIVASCKQALTLTYYLVYQSIQNRESQTDSTVLCVSTQGLKALNQQILSSRPWNWTAQQASLNVLQCDRRRLFYPPLLLSSQPQWGRPCVSPAALPAQVEQLQKENEEMRAEMQSLKVRPVQRIRVAWLCMCATCHMAGCCLVVLLYLSPVPAAFGQVGSTFLLIANLGAHVGSPRPHTGHSSLKPAATHACTR